MTNIFTCVFCTAVFIFFLTIMLFAPHNNMVTVFPSPYLKYKFIHLLKALIIHHDYNVQWFPEWREYWEERQIFVAMSYL